MKNNVNKLKRDLIRDMNEKGMEPKEDLICDGQRHGYWAYVNGEHKRVSYSVTINPLEEDPDGPALVGWYGFDDEKEQHSYSSLKKQ